MQEVTFKDKKFELLIDHQKIQEKIDTIAHKINTDLYNQAPLFICILNGAFMFCSDLLKKINIKGSTITFFRISSYEGITTKGKVKKIMGFIEDIKDRNVVVVEDIIDTGITIVEVLAQINLHRPKQVYLASLLFKPDACKKKLHIDYLGFEIPDLFVIGYGMDYYNLARNLKDIYVLKE